MDANLPDVKEYLNVGFDTRNQLKLFVGERSKIQFESGCKMFDLFLYEPFEVDRPTFYAENYLESIFK